MKWIIFIFLGVSYHSFTGKTDKGCYISRYDGIGYQGEDVLLEKIDFPGILQNLVILFSGALQHGFTIMEENRILVTERNIDVCSVAGVGLSLNEAKNLNSSYTYMLD